MQVFLTGIKQCPRLDDSLPRPEQLPRRARRHADPEGMRQWPHCFPCASCLTIRLQPRERCAHHQCLVGTLLYRPRRWLRNRGRYMGKSAAEPAIGSYEWQCYIGQLDLPQSHWLDRPVSQLFRQPHPRQRCERVQRWPTPDLDRFCRGVGSDNHSGLLLGKHQAYVLYCRSLAVLIWSVVSKSITLDQYEPSGQSVVPGQSVSDKHMSEKARDLESKH